MNTLRCRLRRDAQQFVQGKLSKRLFVPSSSLRCLSFWILFLSVQSTIISSRPKYALWISPFLAFTFSFQAQLLTLNFEAVNLI